MQTLMIDNYDSFTYNLYQMIAKISGNLPLVIQNNELSFDELKKLSFDNVVLSPGPGSPENPSDFGICSQVIQQLERPILGICLGHQGIGCAYGGRVEHAVVPMHGRISRIIHTGTGIFEGIPQSFNAVRYHSLCLANDLPEVFEKIAWTDDDVIMGIRHRQKPMIGVQFHPESIATEYGEKLLENFNEFSLKVIQENKCWSIPRKKEFAVPKNRSSEPKYTLNYRKIYSEFDSEQVFVNIYAEKDASFWLDSSKVVDGFSRFSYMGCPDGPESYVVQYRVATDCVKVVKNGCEQVVQKNIFSFLEEEIRRFQVEKLAALPFDFHGGFVGYFGYEMKEELLLTKNAFESRQDDVSLFFIDRFLVVDHVEKEIYLCGLVKIGEEGQAVSWLEDMGERLAHLEEIKKVVPDVSCESKMFMFRRSESEYLSDIEACKQYIADGESYEICLTNQLSCEVAIDSLTYYRVLRFKNPAPYSSYLKFSAALAVACSSMERFLQVDRNRLVQTKPIKGTLPRGKTAEEEAEFIRQLSTDEKFYSENLMIVDLLRNDLGKVCEIGSVCVPRLMDVETYETLHQLVSTVEGKIRADLSAVDCLKACFPGGSMTGAPKKRAVEIIDTLETCARGIYSGTIGFFSLNGAADWNIVIRTAVLEENQLTIGVGGAIIHLSDAQEEFDEIVLKSKVLVEVANGLPEKSTESKKLCKGKL